MFHDSRRHRIDCDLVSSIIERPRLGTAAEMTRSREMAAMVEDTVQHKDANSSGQVAHQPEIEYPGDPNPDTRIRSNSNAGERGRRLLR